MGAVLVPGWVHLVAMVLTPLTYVVVVFESCCSQEEGFLRELSSDEEVWQNINNVRAVKPDIFVHVQCYHAERNNKKKEYEVVTWKGKMPYGIPYWRDRSGAIPLFTETCTTRLTMPNIVYFSDTGSLQHFETARDAFVEENRHRDTFIRYSIECTIPGLIKRQMVCGRNYVPPWWMSYGYYWLAVLFHLTWPYRWMLNSCSENRDYQVFKEISSRPNLHDHEILEGSNDGPPNLSSSLFSTAWLSMQRHLDIDPALILHGSYWVKVKTKEDESRDASWSQIERELTRLGDGEEEHSDWV